MVALDGRMGKGGGVEGKESCQMFGEKLEVGSCSWDWVVTGESD